MACDDLEPARSMGSPTSTGDNEIRIHRVVSMTSTEAKVDPGPKPARLVVESGVQLPRRRSTVKRASNSSSVASDASPQPEACGAKIKPTMDGEEYNKKSPKDLIDFLRHTTPPPENYMSIPDTYSPSSEEEKQSRLKVFGKRRKSSRRKKSRPMVIKLPDSAVAGTTTDGHRYIAISIPAEHDHPELRSENVMSDAHPAGQPPPRQTGEPESGPPRIITSGPGLVTVLKPVVEDRESAENLMRAQGLTPPTSPKSPPRSTTISSQQNRSRLIQPEATQPQIADTPVICEPPASMRQNPYQHQRQKSSSSSSASGYLTPFMSASPYRRSSMGLGPLPNRRASLDSGMLHRNIGDSCTESNVGTRASIAESILTNGSEPVVVDATTAERYVPIPAQEADLTLQHTNTNPDTVVFAPVLELPSDSGGDDDVNSVGSAPKSSLQRQLSERRRETARQLANILQIRSGKDEHSISPPLRLRPSPARQPEVISEREWMSRLERSRAGSIQDLQVTPVMVVADINPSTGGEATSTSSQPVGESGSGHNQPGEVPPGDTAAAASLDRAPSLPRRHEPIALAQGHHRDSNDHDPSREARERETEARLARLERSGDAWLGAVVPLLESIDRSLARMSRGNALYQQQQEEEQQQWQQQQQQQKHQQQLSPAAPTPTPTPGSKKSRTWPETPATAQFHDHRAVAQAERLGLPSVLGETWMREPEPLSDLRRMRDVGPAPEDGGREKGLATRFRAKARRAMGRGEGEEMEDEPRTGRHWSRRARSLDARLRDNSGEGDLVPPQTPPPFSYRGVTGLFRRPPDFPDFGELRRRQDAREKEIEASFGMSRYGRGGGIRGGRRGPGGSVDMGGFLPRSGSGSSPNLLTPETRDRLAAGLGEFGGDSPKESDVQRHLGF